MVYSGIASHFCSEGIAALWRGNTAEALDCLQTATRLEPRNDAVAKTLACALLLVGDLAAGFRGMDRFWRCPAYPGLDWTGQCLNGETLLIHTDCCGCGDIFMYARFATLAAERGARVVIRAPAGMEQILSTVPGVVEVFSGTRWRLPLQYYRVQMVRLPFIFQTTIDTIPASVPYLRGDPAPWHDVLKGMPGLRAGVCWAGKHGDEAYYAANDRDRSMHLRDMLPLLNVPGVSWLSLQLGPPSAQLAELTHSPIKDVSTRLTDWQATADLIAGLSVVVTVDTAIMHLAAAIGRPTLMLNRHYSDWRYGMERSDSPWYPTSLTVLRQKKPGDWSAPVAEAVRRLRERARSNPGLPRRQHRQKARRSTLPAAVVQYRP